MFKLAEQFTLDKTVEKRRLGKNQTRETLTVISSSIRQVKSCDNGKAIPLSRTADFPGQKAKTSIKRT